MGSRRLKPRWTDCVSAAAALDLATFKIDSQPGCDAANATAALIFSSTFLLPAGAVGSQELDVDPDLGTEEGGRVDRLPLPSVHVRTSASVENNASVQSPACAYFGLFWAKLSKLVPSIHVVVFRPS